MSASHHLAMRASTCHVRPGNDPVIIVSKLNPPPVLITKDEVEARTNKRLSEEAKKKSAWIEEHFPHPRTAAFKKYFHDY